MNNKWKKIVLAMVAVIALAMVAAACGVAPTAKNTAKEADGGVFQLGLSAGLEGYAGPEECAACHVSEYKNWSTSYHTKKAMFGPEHPDRYNNDIYEWVARDWDKLDTYMILDQKDANTNYVAADKVAMKDVDFVIGKARKQRYMSYYDGGPRKAYLQTTKDGGISWAIDKTQMVDYPGNKERAGYKFLAIEVKPKDGEMNKANYGEFRSWQERCIGCHVTGFNPDSWKKAKEEFVAGTRADLKGIFATDIRVSCESCHGPGAKHVMDPKLDNIISPKRLTNDETARLVCQQCHTRPQINTKYGKGAQDNRGFVLGKTKYEDVMQYTRPDWTNGNRQVSIDGKGRRDHQQDMDIMMTGYIKGPNSVHAKLTCYDCHDPHNMGNKKEARTTTYSPESTCVKCHGDKTKDMLKALDGSKGWPKFGFGNFNNEGGRANPMQHIFNLDDQGRTYGIKPEQQTWAVKKDATDLKDPKSWESIWPWEMETYAKGRKTFVGAEPWKKH